MRETIVSIELSKDDNGIAVACEVEGGLLGPGGERRETVYGDAEELLEWLREWMETFGPRATLTR